MGRGLRYFSKKELQMVRKYVRMSLSLMIREIHIKTSVRAPPRGLFTALQTQDWQEAEAPKMVVRLCRLPGTGSRRDQTPSGGAEAEQPDPTHLDPCAGG